MTASPASRGYWYYRVQTEPQQRSNKADLCILRLTHAGYRISPLFDVSVNLILSFLCVATFPHFPSSTTQDKMASLARPFTLRQTCLSISRSSLPRTTAPGISQIVAFHASTKKNILPPLPRECLPDFPLGVVITSITFYDVFLSLP